ncbi:MAG TPA: hypothetical protein VGK31_04310 [Thermoanaerobaculia bacterium]
MALLLFGDLVIAEDSRVFVSDSVSPSIYVIRDGVMQPFIRSGPFTSLQGLTLSPDFLYVSIQPLTPNGLGVARGRFPRQQLARLR